MLMSKKFLNLLIVCGIVSCVSFSAARVLAEEESKAGGILKDGIMGAGIGAVAAGASGGQAGKGALIGAGTSIVGNMLFDSMTAPKKTPAPAPAPQPQYQPAPQPQYYYAAPAPMPAPAPVVYTQEAPSSPVKKAYDTGYQDGYRIGYRDGMRDAKSGY